MPTPVRVRGKRGNKRLIKEHLSLEERPPVELQPKPTRYISMLEQLPNELLHEILWDSLNLDLTRASPLLAQKLNYNRLRKRFINLAFFRCRINNEQFITFPHERFGICMDLVEQLDFRAQVVAQPWFSLDLFRGCVKECYNATIPQTWLNHIAPNEPESRNSHTWNFFPKLFKMLAPSIFQELSIDGFNSGLISPDELDEGVGGIAVHYNEPWLVVSQYYDLKGYLPDHSGIDLAYSWDAENALANEVYYFRVSFGGPRCAVEDNDKIPYWKDKYSEIPEAIINPACWTAKSFHALLLLQSETNNITITNTEQIQALNEGLAKAIKDRYLPAAYLLAGSNKLTGSWRDRGPFEAVIRRLLQEIPTKSTSVSCQWLERWTFETQMLWLMHSGYSNLPDEAKDYQPITNDTLMLAMRTASADSRDVEAFLIYGYVAACFCLGYAERDRILPQSLLRDLYEIALGSVGTRTDFKNSCGMKCYNFLDDAAAEIIGGRRHIERTRDGNLETRRVDEFVPRGLYLGL